MDHFPIFLSLNDQTVIVSGGGNAAIAKLRLLLKTKALIQVYAQNCDPLIEDWHEMGLLRRIAYNFCAADIGQALLLYAANEDATEDKRVSDIARKKNVLFNVVDNLQQSQFITPAIVDRDPVVVAIGTEGTAPILARKIKAQIESNLSINLGKLAELAKGFRTKAAKIPFGQRRRAFWSDFFAGAGETALKLKGEDGVRDALEDLLKQHCDQDPKVNERKKGLVSFVGAGPGDAELLTLKARRLLDCADVVIYDRLVGKHVIEIARREALLINVGKIGFGVSTSQSNINALITEHALSGLDVVRLKGGDASMFGRLDEEITACDAAGLEWHIVPGITAASAAIATLGQSLTQRGRNTQVRFVTGHDVEGFADHDWHALARKNVISAVYMGKRSARFFQGRLLMHGADPITPVSIVENTSLPDEQIIATCLSDLDHTLDQNPLAGPTILFFGLSPRQAQSQMVRSVQEELA